MSFDAAGYEVRQRGDVVARLEWMERKQVSMRGIALSGSWRFLIGRDGRSWMGTAEDEASGRAVAGYYPHWRARRAIAFDDEEWYRLRAPVVGATWKLSAPPRTAVARLRTGSTRGFVERVELAEAAAGVTALPLLILFAIWAVLAEPLTFPVGDLGDFGGGG
jgi:hypothetical protein